MEIRSTRSFNAIPATLIRGVFNLYLSNLLSKMYCKYFFIHLFIFSFSFNHCKFFLFNSRQTYTYLLYVRPHLDYGDVIYHIPQKLCDFSHEVPLHRLMERLESVQYSAGLAITGVWKGTSRDKIYVAGNH